MNPNPNNNTQLFLQGQSQTANLRIRPLMMPAVNFNSQIKAFSNNQIACSMQPQQFLSNQIPTFIPLPENQSLILSHLGQQSLVTPPPPAIRPPPTPLLLINNVNPLMSTQVHQVPVRQQNSINRHFLHKNEMLSFLPLNPPTHLSKLNNLFQFNRFFDSNFNSSRTVGIGASQNASTSTANSLKTKRNDGDSNPAKIFRFEKKTISDMSSQKNLPLTKGSVLNQPANDQVSHDKSQYNRPSNNNHNKNTSSSAIKNEIPKNNDLPSLLSLKIPSPATKLSAVSSLKPPLCSNANNLLPILNDNNSNSSSKHRADPFKHKTISIEDLLQKPDVRPPKIVLIFRGLPGSGKSYLANLIKHEEEKISSSKPKILSIDNYFMCEQEDSNKRTTKQSLIEYEYDQSMDETYQQSLVKSFKKTIESNLFDFIIVDMVNEKTVHIEDMYSFAKSKGFQLSSTAFKVFIIEMTNGVELCTKRNVHKRTLKDIKDLSSCWEPLPHYFIKLDCRSILQDDAIENVEMGEVDDTGSQVSDEVVEKTESAENDHDNDIFDLSKSKWDNHDMSEDRMNRLDGLIHKRQQSNSNQINLSLDSYLEMNLKSENTDNGKKRVRWKDFEEKKRIDKQKEFGFIVGQTAEDWEKMTGNSCEKTQSALTTYKYI